jgi:hypothetical protein
MKTHLQTPFLHHADRIAVCAVLVIIALIILFAIRLHPTGERPVFSDGWIRDGLTSRWKPPFIFFDDSSNGCALDVQDNTVLIIEIEEKQQEPDFNLRPLGPKYFEVAFKPNVTANSLLGLKSIHLAARENTVFFVTDRLDFRIADLKPKSAATMRKAIEDAVANGKRLPDFDRYIQEFIIQGQSKN